MVNIEKTGVGSTLTFENQVVRMRNITGGAGTLARGDIVETFLEPVAPAGLETGAAATTWTLVGPADVPLDRVPARVIGVALEDALYGEYLRVGFKGVFECACVDDADEGVLLWLDANGRLGKADTAPDASPAGYIMMLGIALENTAATGDLTKVLFDGLNGFTASHP